MLINKAKPQLCDFESAEDVFFPIIDNSDENHVIPESARKEIFVGIAALDRNFPKNLILNTVKGVSHFHDKVPLIFSSFPPSDDQSPEAIRSYWQILKAHKRKFGNATSWNVVPETVFQFLLSECLAGRKRVHYHDPGKITERHLFAVTQSNSRTKLYRVDEPIQIRLINSN